MLDVTDKKHRYARFLSASSERFQILLHLHENPSSPRDITETFPISRSCVQDTLRKLIEKDWAEKRGGKYHLTTNGKIITDWHERYVDTLAHIAACEPFIHNIPDHEYMPELRWLHDANVIIADSNRPYAPMTQFVQSLRERSIQQVRGIMPVLSQPFINTQKELLERGIETELILGADTVAVIRSTNPETAKAALDPDLFTLYEYEGGVEFGLTLVDERILMGAYNRNGQLRALVDSANPEFFEWAEELYASHQEEAQSIEPDGLYAADGSAVK